MKKYIAAIVLTLIVSDVVSAQVTWGKQSLKRGKLWETVWNSLQYGDPTETENGFFTLDYPGYSKGTRVTDALNYAEAAGYAIYGVRQKIASSYTINSRFFPSGQDVFPIEEAMLTKMRGCFGALRVFAGAVCFGAPLGFRAAGAVEARTGVDWLMGSCQRWGK